jgi:hypothetical protein
LNCFNTTFVSIFVQVCFGERTNTAGVWSMPYYWRSCCQLCWQSLVSQAQPMGLLLPAHAAAVVFLTLQDGAQMMKE